MDSDAGTPSPESAQVAPPKRKTTPFSGREDCWSPAATETLIEAWGERFLELNRGSLRQKQWQEVADAVNSKHHAGAAAAHRRSDVQCKNRIDTLKKKYKIEKSKSSSPWPFFPRLDALFGPSLTSPAPPAGRSRRVSPPPSWTISSPIPVGRRSLTRKRPAESPAPVPAPAPARGMSAFLAAVEAMEQEEASEQGGSAGDLAAAIERLGETYERVERAKQRQMMELERQRMQFTKDLECQRMQLFMETQLHLQRIKRSKRSPPPAAATAPAAADNYA